MHGNSTEDCTDDELRFLSKHVRGFLLGVDALLVLNTMLMGVIAGIGAYGHRYRHHPLIRFLYLGATTFPYTFNIYIKSNRVITAECGASEHVILVMLWIGLVQIVCTNANATVAGDSREGRSIAPPLVQLVQAIWTSYIAYIIIESGGSPSGYVKWNKDNMLYSFIYLIFAIPYALILAKLLFKYYAWYKARRSLALGRNPRLIVGYMEQMQYGTHHAELVSQHVPPPLIVMREGIVLVEEQPHGYNLIGMSNNGLVTIDQVWKLDDMVLPRPAEQHKVLCLSFALFKLLCCRFARYTISEAGCMEVSNFIRHVLLTDSDDERVLGVIERELSFLHDYYYTSLPISYSQTWLPILGVSISVPSIGYCLFVIVFCVLWFHSERYEQIGYKKVFCHSTLGRIFIERDLVGFLGFYHGTLLFDLLSIYLLAALVVLVEVREITSYICSNWTKVALICGYVKHTSCQQSLMVRKCIDLVLSTRCMLSGHWEDKMNQCSILALHPSINVVSLLRHILNLPDHKEKVPRVVKVAIVDAVRRFDQRRIRHRSNLGATPLQLRAGNELLWTFHGAKGVADAILMCHVATSILEMASSQRQLLSDHEIVATHLSRYCAYLVAYSPKLLPDDAVWCRSLYKAVKKDAERSLVGCGITISTDYGRVVELLSTRSKHHVLRDGVELGWRLAELPEGEEVAWKALAEFWSETVVCIAASCDDMDEHAEAIARGGELITLLWALLYHVGSVDDATTAATHGAPDDVV
ncbi:hypothetical protein VPH35_017184 [Triticum aestivum]